MKVNQLQELITNSVQGAIDHYKLTANDQNPDWAGFKSEVTNKIFRDIQQNVEYEALKNKLDILFTYEQRYLTLIKDFKEEIKFANTLQEDLRKERAKFFSETLHEVSSTLTNAQIESSVASKWIQDLVLTYTTSLDLSSNLIDENTLDTIGKIREMAQAGNASIGLTEHNEQPK
ncbi:hypothetical protein [Neisseria montereyensis]|uniref:Nickel transporter n=1 Tax=Neisseria montereyensis TaxID=2973938 RepID=A0ABT2FEA1_9NEIS|nr:hypothetical protein [Neisseria montereyensis]MCS4534506.1 hypothetical protein [Neisseria montereyensis]